jgi:glycosyltransferase involved in cell wall biosynthesis
MDQLKASIIIAARNEEDNILQCLSSLVAVLPPEVDIVVVHGGSDRTSEIAATFARQHPNVRVIRNENDRGKGHAIKRGIQEAYGSIMAQFDCDLQFLASDLPALLAPLINGTADVVVGSRFLPAANRAAYQPVFFRDVGNRLLSGLVSLLAGQKVTDVTTGMKAWTRTAIETIDFTDERYSYEAEIVLKACHRNLRLIEIPIGYASRQQGESMHRSTTGLMRAGLTIAFHCIRWQWATRK